MSIKNKGLTVWQSEGLYTMPVYPVSYTLVNGSYDYLSDTGIGATAIAQFIPAYPVQMKETTASEAFEQFQTTNKDKTGNFDVPFIVI